MLQFGRIRILTNDPVWFYIEYISLSIYYSIHSECIDFTCVSHICTSGCGSNAYDFISLTATLPSLLTAFFGFFFFFLVWLKSSQPFRTNNFFSVIKSLFFVLFLWHESLQTTYIHTQGVHCTGCYVIPLYIHAVLLSFHYTSGMNLLSLCSK